MLIVIILIIVVAAIIVASVTKKKSKNSSTGGINNVEAMRLKDEVSSLKVSSWGELIKILVISGIFGAIGYFLADAIDEDVVTWTIFAAGFPWGYSVIGKVIDDWVELYAALASGVLWFILVIIKIALSLFLGVILMPIKIIVSIYNIIKAHNLSKEVTVTINNSKQENAPVENTAKNDIVKKEENVSSEDTNSIVKKMEQLKEMKEKGLINETEFEEKKKEVLSKI